MSNKIKKLCLSLALAAVVGVSAGASACTVKSSHPTAKITVSFNKHTYEIEYTLYRNMYPQTVQHFIELADAGFYDNTIIHDYSSTDWVGGGYWYNKNGVSYANSYSSAMTQYLEDNSKEKEYYDLVYAGIKNDTFTPSVFSSETYNSDNELIVSDDDALATLYGEFSDNNHKIEGDKGLKAEYGTLKMVYYKKEINKNVSLKDSFGKILYGNYRNNCATSLFSMQMSSGTSYAASSYSVFGQLKNDSARNRLEELTDAVNDYKSSVTGSSWTTTVETIVDRFDMYEKDKETTFKMIAEPIIITKIEITKY